MSKPCTKSVQETAKKPPNRVYDTTQTVPMITAVE
ncbi:Uncharacterised protein [Vibrio cholerae]|nr:Uncharacterised protein [Vibrio cholerae]CSC91671.1 Uncharacterised protein [Vibrio cholerae]